ncbi:hypothetical protein KSF78_0008975 [Schistosoma japonicum]|nr:hypothetical protein KSF78_0008975 [Schistosoma japonicum]
MEYITIGKEYTLYLSMFTYFIIALLLLQSFAATGTNGNVPTNNYTVCILYQQIQYPLDEHLSKFVLCHTVSIVDGCWWCGAGGVGDYIRFRRNNGMILIFYLLDSV